MGKSDLYLLGILSNFLEICGNFGDVGHVQQ